MILIIAAFPFSLQAIDVIKSTAEIDQRQLATYGPTELIKLKIFVSTLISLIISLPLWFRGLYNFSSPGLTPKEKDMIKLSFFTSLFLFCIGAFTGLFHISPIIIDFLLSGITAKENLSIYKTVKLVISISIFSGLLTCLPTLTLYFMKKIENKNQIRKTALAIIFLVLIVVTPESDTIINLVFLVCFTLIVEMTMMISRSYS